jgi:hypothetical protein
MNEITLIFDVKLKRPGCALIQALGGCPSHPLYDFWDTKDWLLSPTPDMRRVTGTVEEWRAISGDK